MHCVDLGESFFFEQIANSNEYLLAKISFDTAENESLKVCLLVMFNFQVMGFNFHLGIPPVSRTEPSAASSARSRRCSASSHRRAVYSLGSGD